MTPVLNPDASRPTEANEGFSSSVLLKESIRAVAETSGISATSIVETINEAGEKGLLNKFIGIQTEASRPDGEYSKVRYEVKRLLELRGYEDVRIEELPPSIDRWLNKERAVKAVNERRAGETQGTTHNHKFVIETPFAQTEVLSLSSRQELTPREIQEIETLTNALSTSRLWEQAEYYKPFLTDAALIRLLDENYATTKRFEGAVCLVDMAGSTERQSIVTKEGRPSLTIPVLTQETLGAAVLGFNKGMDKTGPTVQGDRPGDAIFNYAFMAIDSPRNKKVSAAVSAIETAVRIQEELMSKKYEEKVLQIQGKVVLSFGSVDAQNIGKLGDKSRGVLFTGECINALARLEKKAGAGQILVVFDELEGSVAKEALQIFMSTITKERGFIITEGLADPFDPEQAAGLKGLTEKVRYAIITLPKVKEPELPEIGSTVSESATE